MIHIQNLTHTYRNRGEEALKDINIEIGRGENVVMIGSSGSGKSTLLKAINGLIKPSSGRILIDNEDIFNYPVKEARKVRGNVGMIFQNFNLIERETVLRNALNGRLRYNSSFRTVLGMFSKEDYQVVRENLQIVGLEGYENEQVANLSGGQKQRVAIARALSQEPEVILADEPVSNLDPRLMQEIMDLLKNICTEKNITLITSLHFLGFAKKYASRMIGMKDGKIIFDGVPESLTEEEITAIYGESNGRHLRGQPGK
jgi:phosphonate transport system ATP-binding protein